MTTGGAAARPARARLPGGRNTFQPPGRKPADVLADAIIHSQDIFVPLGIDWHVGAAARRAHPGPAALIRAVDVLALCVTDDDGVREITTRADATATSRPGLIAVSHGTGDPQLHERGKRAAGRLAGTALLLARPAGVRS